MLYLDYSATTPIDNRVLKYYNYLSKFYIGNPNSLHSLGKKGKEFIDLCSKEILDLLNLSDMDVIYTSGSSESNNEVIKGLATRVNKRHIITTSFEHSSITTPLGYLQKNGYKIDFLNTDEFGRVDLNHLKELINEDTFLVSIGTVNSEIGILQPLDQIKAILKDYKDVYFHTDATQAIGKINIDFKDIDFISFSAHKFYGPKGIGVLLKKKDIKLDMLIHGGKSTTKFRSGTPALPLIGALTQAFSLSIYELDKKEEYVKNLSEYLKYKLSSFKDVVINSNEYCIPHILNISLLGKDSADTVTKFEENDIYISNHTACSSDAPKSLGVLSLTKDEERAKSSVRISLSYLTSKKDIDKFIKVLERLM